MMVHSPKFNKVKHYYNKGLWNETRVANAIVKGWITEEEYEEIVGHLTQDNEEAAGE